MTVELRSICKSFGAVPALQDISLHLEEGKFLTLLGPTGCGKSTLLRIIAGFVTPTAGEVLIGGQSLHGVPPNRRQIGLLFQNYALFPHMTVENNVAFGLRMQRMKKQAVAEKVAAILPLVGIEHLRTRYPSQLSGGQQQRTALARTLVIEPRVLLLDEPLAALDRKLKLEMQSELKKLVSRLKITTISVSHDQDEALTMSDYVAVMNGGRVEQFGPPLELYDRPLSGFTAGFLGRSNVLEGHFETDGEGGQVFRSQGVAIPVTDFARKDDAATKLMVRPEHLTIERSATTNSLAGRVSFVTQFGHSMQYEVLLDAGPVFLVTVTRPRDVAPIPVGERVFLVATSPSAYRTISD